MDPVQSEKKSGPESSLTLSDLIYPIERYAFWNVFFFPPKKVRVLAELLFVTNSDCNISIGMFNYEHSNDISDPTPESVKEKKGGIRHHTGGGGRRTPRAMSMRRVTGVFGGDSIKRCAHFCAAATACIKDVRERFNESFS